MKKNVRGRPKTCKPFSRKLMNEVLHEKGYTQSLFCDELLLNNNRIAQKYINGFYDSFTWYMKNQEMPLWVLDEICKYLDVLPEYIQGFIGKMRTKNSDDIIETIPSYSLHLVISSDSSEILRQYLISIGILKPDNLIESDKLDEINDKIMLYCYSIFSEF